MERRATGAKPGVTGVLTTSGLALAGAGVALGWWRFVADEYILPEVVLLSAGLLIAAAGLALSARRAALPPLSTALDRPLLAVLAAWGLSAAFSVDPRYSLLGTYGSYTYGLWQAASCAVLFVLTACATDAAARRRLVKAALGAAMLASAYAVLQAAELDPLVPASALAGHRAVSTLGTPVFLGAYLALWFPVAFHEALSGEDRNFGRAALALIAAGSLASVSRGAWLAAAAGAGVYLGLTGQLRAPRWSRARWAAAVLCVAAVAAWVVRALARRQALGVGFGLETQRVAIWGAAVAVFAKHPWLGVGPDAFEQGLRLVRTERFIHLLGFGFHLGHAHNDFLQVLSTTGLVGTAAYAWLLVAFVAESRRALAADSGVERSADAALVAGLAAFFVNLQLNIVSLPAFASGALAAGLLLRRRAAAAPGGGSSRFRLGLALAFAAASTVLALRLVAADRAFKRATMAADADGALGLYRSALALDPCELAYHLAYANALSARAGDAAVPAAARLDAVDRIAASGETATACHPNDAVAHYIAGTGALMQAILGRRERLAAAEAGLDEALRLDPYRLDIIDWRRQAATLRGDKELERALLERYARVRALRP